MIGYAIEQERENFGTLDNFAAMNQVEQNQESDILRKVRSAQPQWQGPIKVPKPGPGGHWIYKNVVLNSIKLNLWIDLQMEYFF